MGSKKLGDLIRASELFDVDMRHDGTAMFIRGTRRSQKSVEKNQSYE